VLTDVAPIRSAKARALTQSPARRTGLAMNRLVEQALGRLDSELRTGANAQPLGALWAIAAEGRRGADPSATSAHDDLYHDDSDLPK
jgi:antitoxin VapB